MKKRRGRKTDIEELGEERIEKGRGIRKQDKEQRKKS